MPSLTYPLDITGLAATNLIASEVHTLTEINSSTYRILIPEFAPFYLDNLELKHTDSLGVSTVLTEGSDYFLCLPYIGATRSVGKMIYGGISINTLFVNGVLKLTYQTLGGDWTADANYVLTRLAETVYNPRITVWDSVTDKTSCFPPTNHDQHMDYVFGHGELIASINDLATTIGSGPSNSNGMVGHILDENNPHLTTKAQIGLGDVENLPMATDTEVTTLQTVDKYVTLRQILLLLDTIKPDVPVQVQISLTSSSIVDGIKYVLFTIATDVNVDLGVLVWTLEHITTDDADFVSVTGPISFNGYQGQFVVAIHADVLGEEPEQFRVAVRSETIDGGIVTITPIIFLGQEAADPVSIIKPIITTPIDNSIDVSTSLNLTSSPFALLTGTDTHTSSDWQLATDLNFINMVSQVNDSLTDKVQWSVVDLANMTTHYVRVRYKSASGIYSEWSNITTFRTEALAVVEPVSDQTVLSILTACCEYNPDIQITAESLYLLKDSSSSNFFRGDGGAIVTPTPSEVELLDLLITCCKYDPNLELTAEALYLVDGYDDVSPHLEVI